ncbi:MAG: ribosomal protein S18-alanine N-acetyltransferase [Gemmatimonadota bacterium]|nr:ribosomal protein S18-alanine N-acetyltransferase [Gemmatimonadota bacterium]
MSAADQKDPDWLIRPLSFSDLPAILAIENMSYSTPWRESTFLSLMRRGDTDIIGLTVTGWLVGYAISWTVGDQAELGNLAVTPLERGKGIGARLINASLERVRERGASVCFLEVRVSNNGARLLYERLGFQSIGRRRDYYAKPREDAIVMRCDLI